MIGWGGQDFRESFSESCGRVAKGRKSRESCGVGLGRVAKGRKLRESCGVGMYQLTLCVRAQTYLWLTLECSLPSAPEAFAKVSRKLR